MSAVNFILGSNIRWWTVYSVADCTDEEAETLRQPDSAEAVALARKLDEAGRLDVVSESHDEGPDLFADYAEPNVFDVEVEPDWFRSPHPNSKWHLIRDIGVHREVRVLSAVCGTGIGDNGTVLKRIARPSDAICKKCNTINEGASK